VGLVTGQDVVSCGTACASVGFRNPVFQSALDLLIEAFWLYFFLQIFVF
jgi:hypothetical protein